MTNFKIFGIFGPHGTIISGFAHMWQTGQIQNFQVQTKLEGKSANYSTVRSEYAKNLKITLNDDNLSYIFAK